MDQPSNAILVSPAGARALTGIAVTVIEIILIIMGITRLAINYYFNRKVHQVASWDKTNAVVTKSKITGTIDGSSYYVSVEYEYEVNGQRYTADNIKASGCNIIADAAIVKSLVIGANISVYYNRFNPGEAYLLAGEKYFSGYFWGSVWLLLGVAGLIKSMDNPNWLLS